MKERYIDLMEKALNAYSDERIVDFFARVKEKGLTEHGFPRLTSNMGILISRGRRVDLLPLFLEMMDFCCYWIPKVKAANDFSVREIVFCILEVEKSGIVDKERIELWKSNLKEIDPETCYNSVAKTRFDVKFNWTAFVAVSEFARQKEGLTLVDNSEFIETQLATQLNWLDENGMYRDSGTIWDGAVYPPIVYDFVPRGLFSILLHLGYRGKYYAEIDAALRKAGLITLEMLSSAGEAPYGGRSNQFIHNETWMAIIFEFEAKRYMKEGNVALAQRFKEAANRAVSSVELWLSKEPVRHIKNRYPTETQYGCQGYAYFDKYMITTASFLYLAYLICDDSIEAADFDTSPTAIKTSSDFHKVFMRCGEYSVEFDTCADPHYESNGLGRVHRRGAPATICMSMPCTNTPIYKVDIDDSALLSICPGIMTDKGWEFATNTRHDLRKLSTSDSVSYAKFVCILDEVLHETKNFVEDGTFVEAEYSVSDSGVDITVNSKGTVALMLPAFDFDGEKHTEITLDDNTLSISYEGWVCRYTTDGKITATDEIAANCNGHYKKFIAHSKESLNVKITISKAE
ncbi:MAG: hypothetical protein E7672_07365 [Ruminococcaceae bacterium]|nr:hypothetical protein [Oscillospiraceae bacterium]